MTSLSEWIKKAKQNPAKNRAEIQKRIEEVKRKDIESRAGTVHQRKVVSYTNLSRDDADSCSFDKIKDRGFNMEALNTLRNWTPDRSWGVMLWGKVGSGKTQLIKALMIDWAVKKKCRGYFINLVDLQNKFIEHREAIQDYKIQLLRNDILAIDDLGAENTTDFVQRELLSLVEARLSIGKGLFMTTNNDKKKLLEIYELRILDRLQAIMHWVKCDGESYRRELNKKITEEATSWKK
jgi:DNA replication protein DnaC